MANRGVTPGALQPLGLTMHDVAIDGGGDVFMTATAGVFGNAVIELRDLDRVRKITLANIQQEKVQPFTMGLRVLPPLLYGSDHAYGQPLTGSGTEASVAAMTRQDLVAFHQMALRKLS